MQRKTPGGWVYIMTNRYRGTLYIGSTTDLAQRIYEHREGRGSEFCAQHGLTRLVWAERTDSIVDAKHQEKRLKRWRREWKFALIEKANPDWENLFNQII
jgi:putative endonuclease